MSGREGERRETAQAGARLRPAKEIADAALKVIADQGAGAVHLPRHRQGGRLTDGALFRHFATNRTSEWRGIDRVEEILLRKHRSGRETRSTSSAPFFQHRVATIQANPGVARLVLSEDLARAAPAGAVKRVTAFRQRSPASCGSASPRPIASACSPAASRWPRRTSWSTAPSWRSPTRRGWRRPASRWPAWRRGLAAAGAVPPARHEVAPGRRPLGGPEATRSRPGWGPARPRPAPRRLRGAASRVIRWTTTTIHRRHATERGR